MKDDKFIPELGRIFETSADSISKEVLGQYDDLKGFEELITGGIKSRLTTSLLSDVQKKLNGKQIGDVKFKVQVFRKSTENKIGADLGGVFKFKKNGKELKKAFLAQAKVGKINPKKQNIYCSNNDIQTQAENMLKYSSDSFFFVYTKNGIRVFSAMEVYLNGKPSINSEELYLYKFGHFMKEFFKCFIGDHLIAGIYDDTRHLLNSLQVENVIEVEATKIE